MKTTCSKVVDKVSKDCLCHIFAYFSIGKTLYTI